MEEKLDLSTMEMARAKAYNIFGNRRLTPESTRNQINAVKYIEHLGAVTNTDVSKWPIVEIFGIKNHKLLPTDKNELNEIFFRFLKTAPAHGVVKPPDAAMAAKITDVYRRMISRSLGNLDKEKNRLQDVLYDFADQVTKVQEDILRLTIGRRGMMKMTEGDQKFYEELERILNRGFFIFDPSDYQPSDGLLFRTKPIIISYYNDEHAIEQVVQMGWYKVNLIVGSNGLLNVRVDLGHDNPVFEGYYHPHVSHKGIVCWGNMLKRAHAAMASMELSTLLNTLQQVLIHYNDDNPYAGIGDFEGAFNKKWLSVNGKLPTEDDLTYDDEEERDEPENDEHHF